MNRKEAARITHQEGVLMSFGFTLTECEQLRRISSTLRNWFERECGDERGCIERDETTGKAYFRSSINGQRWMIPDRETGARKRLAAIMHSVNCTHKNPLSAYIQTDPRGAALYIIRPGDVPEGYDVEACYSRGICVY